MNQRCGKAGPVMPSKQQAPWPWALGWWDGGPEVGGASRDPRLRPHTPPMGHPFPGSLRGRGSVLHHPEKKWKKKEVNKRLLGAGLVPSHVPDFLLFVQSESHFGVRWMEPQFPLVKWGRFIYCDQGHKQQGLQRCQALPPSERVERGRLPALRSPHSSGSRAEMERRQAASA